MTFHGAVLIDVRDEGAFFPGPHELVKSHPLVVIPDYHHHSPTGSIIFFGEVTENSRTFRTIQSDKFNAGQMNDPFPLEPV
jgi:hypothetical protein